jgi:hypothetical protein
MSAWYRLIKTGRVMRQAFHEQQACIHDIYDRIEPYLHSPGDTPAAYAVRPGRVPAAFFTWRKNLFSTLFHSAYLLLDCPEPRRRLYGRLIHLYRIWVTSADNLLDEEDKVVVPVRMPGSSRVMRQVVALMAADRVLADILNEAVEEGTIDRQIAACLQRESLCRLLPSAAEEAAEEGGIGLRPDPEHVLEVIHRLKTGLLFNIAFAGPEIAEPSLSPVRLGTIKSALMQFGLGCQLLDDVRDLGSDLREQRHNYLLSWFTHHQPEALPGLTARAADGEDRLYLHAPRCAAMAAQRGWQMMRDGLVQLGQEGLEFDSDEANRMARFMFTMLDLKELSHAA